MAGQQIDIVANLLMKVDGAEAGINKLKSSLSKLKMPEGLENSFKKSFANLDTLFARYKSQIEKGFDTKADVNAFSKTSKALDAELTRISKHFTELTGKEINFKVKSDDIIRTEKELEKLFNIKNQLSKDSLKFEVQGGKDGVKNIETLLQRLQAVAGKTKTGEYAANALNFLKTGDVQSAITQLDKASASFKRLKQEKQDAFKDTGFDMGGAITAMISILSGAEGKFGDVNAKITETKNNLASFQADQIQKAGDYVEDLANKFAKDETAIRQADVAMQDFARSSQSMSQQLGDLQQSTQYFFSLRNMINLFKRGIDEAIQSVKELDAAMTETAVVTDYKVSDMWNMLPQYTQLANQLGATTQGAYETMTLYFQQGLDQQQAFELGAETMKMARIAGLDYAETTDMMTAALRGFNMELNETSAKRVNDVYSELAAITASDTEELGTAMQRTASIAASAGASFEGTTAFLAQAIETTREPAENIGTAMKTIVARFQEMKKNPLEISEVDGEEVDYNKIDAALKTIGVDLKDANGQFRDFDKVMLDISAKWDTLSQSQQRYIATTAAGSRQQSRFIAMVSNYDRTMQLMEAANDSAGASEEQFEKTMDSLESKLNKLHNAWQQFTMGIANNGMIKLAVDGITKLLGGVNSLIDGLSLGSGTIKSFLSLFTAFTGLKASGKIMNSLIGGLGGMVDPTSTFSAGFGRGFLGNRAAGNAQLASQINQPIVAELRALRKEQGQQFKQNQQNKSGAYDSYNQFKAANQQIRQLTGKNGYKTTQLKDILGSLDKGDQNKLMRHMSGTIASTRSSLMSYYQKQNPLAAQGIKQQFGYLNNQRKIGELSWKEYYDAISDPELLKRGLDSSTEAGKAAERMLTGMAAKVNQKVDSAVRSQALSNLSTNEDYNNSDRVNQQKIYQQEVSKLKADAKYMAKTRTGILEGMLPEIKNSKWAQRVDSLGKVSAGITSAGMGIQSFGNLLISSANPALQAFGSTLVSIGGVVSNLGMGLGGLASSFSAVAGSDFMGSIAKQIGVGAGALTAGLGIAAAAIAGIAIAIKKHNDNIKKAAEEVTSNYKEQNEEHQSNISNLESYREDFARLSAGVDANGMNINLDTADYERYLEITKALADINPDIVDGYNAQGNAIISNKNALEDTLALEKERQAETFNTYTSDDSTNTLLKARNLSRIYKEVKTGVGGEYTSSQSIQGYEFAPQADMRKQAKKIGQTLSKGIKEGWISEDALSDFDIKIDDLAKGADDAVSAFEQNYDKVKARISSKMDSAGDELKDSTKESMLDAFSGYNEAADELDELITPLYEQTLAKVGKEIQVPAEFKSFLNQGVKDIVSDANITDIDGEIAKLTSSFSALGKEGSEYSKILADVEKAQDDYAASLDANAYDEFVHGSDGAIERIQALKDELLRGVDTTQGYGKAISEFLKNEITKIEDFTKAGAANLQQALNTMTSEIEAAEGALENFNAIAEGSTYGKAASNMSQIFETATADEHALGQGDQAFWAGAEALVGRKNLLEDGGTNKDKALKQMQRVQEMLKGGEEGWNNFKNKWFDTVDANAKYITDKNGETIGQLMHQTADGTKEAIKGLTLDENGGIAEIDDKLNPQVYDQIADALNMSKESLIAMLNLGRQFGEISFTNVSDVRKALATSESTIKNANNGKVFVRRESLESEMTSAGIDLNKQQEIERDLQKNYNTELIKSANEISKTNNQFAEMGITSMESLVKTFDDTGQFTKDEIQAYAEKYAEINGEGFNQSKFDEYWQKNQEDSQFGGIPSSLDSIQSILSSIESILASQRLSEGYLDNTTAQQTKDWLLGGKGQDTDAQYYWKGKSSNGENITASQYNKTSKELDDFIASSEKYVAELSRAEEAARARGDAEEANKIKAEREAYDAEDTGYIDLAKKYRFEGQEAYESQIQSALDGISKDKEVIKNGLSEIFGKITPDQINTDAAQSALNQLYEAAINNTPTVLTDGIMTQMQNLGIDIQKAIDAGLVVDTNGIYAAGQEAGAEAGNSVGQGAEAGASNASTGAGAAAAEAKGKESVEKTDEGAKAGAEGASTEGGAAAAEEKAREGLNAYMRGLNSAKPTVTPKAPTQAVGAKASFDNSAVKTGVAAINGMSAKIKVGADTQSALTTAESARKTIDGKSATINVSTSVKGQNVDIYVTKHVTTKGGEPPHTGGYITSAGVIYRAHGGIAEHPGYPKKGTDIIPAYLTPGEYVQNRGAVNYFGIDFMRKINHKDLIGALQSFGSAAKGKYGRLGPRGNGGLTLTGERGFEIAWLPSEGRSLILGADGPQMADLPSDAIVWDHEQSKKIFARDAIPAGSQGYTKGKMTRTGGSSGGKSSKKKKKSKKKKSKKSKQKDITPTINNWSIEEAVRYNIDQSLASITEEISLRTKDIEKNLEKIGTTYNDIVGSTQAQIDALGQVKQKNQELLASNQRQLADYRAQQQYVSWTDSNGESQRTLINIGQFLASDGKIDYNAIQSFAGGNRALQEALFKEVSSGKGMADGMRNALKAIADADQQIADLGKKISEAFYQWENELTEVYSLTKRINNEVSFTNRFTSQVELELAKLGAGFTDTAKAIANTRNVLIRNNATIQAQIKNQQQMVAARQRELEAALSYEDEVNKYKKFEAKTDWDSEATKTATLEWAKNLETGARLGYKYVADSIFKDIDGSIQYQIDWEKFNADNEANPYSKADYEAIKKYLDDLDSAATEFNNSIKDQTDFIKQTYDALKEYQDYVADMEDTLIKGVEEQIDQAKDNAKQLSDSITSALKDLLDEVKRKLDERRKQEDNAKTERDISQKQQRLAMLRADTAGGHQVEIAQLEKEIADSQQSYQRTLEDQLLDRLQQQADEASEQRERQIELMQAGNQIDAATNKELVDMWLKDPEKYKEEIKAAWLEAQGYDEKGEAGQYVLESQFESDFAQLVTAVEESNFKDNFNALTADTNSLAALLNELTNEQLGRQDELAHSTNALLDVTDRNTTSILTEMQKQNSAAMLKAKGADAATLKTLGYTAQQMLEGNYTPEELRQAGYTAKELAEGGITDVGTLKNAGYEAKDIKEANVGNASDFKEADFTAEELKDLFSLDELVDALFDAKALKNAGYDANALKGAGFGIQQLKDAGYTLPQLKSAFSATEFGAGGISYDDAKAAGYGLNDLKPVLEYASQAQQEQAAIDAAAAAAAAAARVGNGNPYGAASQTSGKINKGDKGNQVRSIQWALKQMGYYPHTIDGDFGNNTKKAVKAFQKAVGITQDGVVGPNTRKAFAAKGYKTGGLADYTGPAWLDGTPSKPELVLNPTDTKNFLALRDVLSSAMKSTSAVTNSYGGDVMYDINIHVDKIEKDYDVDRVVDKVKKEITKGAGYRNVTQVRNFK